MTYDSEQAYNITVNPRNRSIWSAMSWNICHNFSRLPRAIFNSSCAPTRNPSIKSPFVLQTESTLNWWMFFSVWTENVCHEMMMIIIIILKVTLDFCTEHIKQTMIQIPCHSFGRDRAYAAAPIIIVHDCARVDNNYYSCKRQSTIQLNVILYVRTQRWSWATRNDDNGYKFYSTQNH